jgi:predicted dinucleotide-binding enzyme
MFLWGDHARAKAQIYEMVEQFGWEPFDCGGTVAARALERRAQPVDPRV